MKWRQQAQTLRLLVLSTIFLIFPCETEACTVPVFRYALDQWRGESDPAVQDPAVLSEIANRILAGDSAVWIQVDSGDEAADNAAFERLAARLKFFESVAELPEIDPNDPSSQLGPGPPLTLQFSTLRLQRSHPITKMLVGPNLDSLPKDEAWIAPVFGRGRVLGIWPESLMDEEGIDEACFYLTGACSCQVKLQNPGWDLVMNVKWDERLYLASQGESPEAPLALEVKKETRPEPEEVTFTPLWRPPTADINLTALLAIGLIIAGVVVLIKTRKSKSG